MGNASGSPGNTASVDTSGSYATASYSTGTCIGSVATSGYPAPGIVGTAIHGRDTINSGIAYKTACNTSGSTFNTDGHAAVAREPGA